MSTVMTAERIRLIIDTEDDVRRAVHLRRLKMPGTASVSDVVNAILRAALAREIEEVRAYGVGEPEPEPEPKKRKGGRR
jgi:hypothetical protein